MTKKIYKVDAYALVRHSYLGYCTTHVLWPPESDPGDARHLLQAEGEESLAGLALRARLDLVERSLRGRVLLVIVVVVMVVVMIVVVLLVVRVDLLKSGRHLCDAKVRTKLNARYALGVCSEATCDIRVVAVPSTRLASSSARKQ